MEFELLPHEREAIIDRLAEQLISEYRGDLELFSPAQVAGILDLSIKTLATLDIPRVTIVPNKIIRYRLSDVKAWLADNRA